jgi:hypothetical protein
MRLIILLLGFMLTGCASTQNFVEKTAITDSHLTAPQLAKYAQGSNISVDHSAFDDFLKTYLIVTDDARAPAYGAALVRYADVSPAARAALSAYVQRLQAVNVTTLSRPEQLAFWINLYNADTILAILENYTVDSIRSIKTSPFDFKGPWNDPRLTVSGTPLTLDTIENGIVRPVFDDPRIHYALNCAAIGCPSLRASAYRAAGLNSALDEQARAFINNPRGVRIENDKLIVSRIFLWYKEDYGSTDTNILAHIRKYASPALIRSLQGKTKIDGYAYDWDLNDANAR